jgi:hypothetical protein
MLQVHCIWSIKQVQLSMPPGTSTGRWQSLLSVCLYRKADALLSKNVQPVIKLEVTVPHIALSLRGNQVEGRAEADLQHSSERLRILPLGQQSGTSPGQYGEFATTLSHDQKGRFRLFQVNNIVAQGGGFLLQILRMYPASRSQGNRREQAGQLRASDNLAFTIEFRHEGNLPEIAQAHSFPHLRPGLNSVVIYLDAEGKPGNYSIDGARS